MNVSKVNAYSLSQKAYIRPKDEDQILKTDDSHQTNVLLFTELLSA